MPGCLTFATHLLSERWGCKDGATVCLYSLRGHPARCSRTRAQVFRQANPGSLVICLSARAQVFHQAYIPRRLEEVEDHERDFDRLARGAGAADGIYYQTLAGMRPDMTGAAPEPAIVRAANGAAAAGAGAPAGGTDDERDAHGASAHERPECSSAAAGGGAGPGSGPGPDPDPVGQPHDRAGGGPETRVGDRRGDSDSEGSSEAGSGDEDFEGSGDDRAARGAPADPEAARAERKAHKAAVKEANRERRKHKVPKHVKKHALAKHKKK